MTVNFVKKSHVANALMCCLVLALSACGGGSGDSPTTAAASGSSSSASSGSSSSGGNQAPTISGTPAAAVVMGATYSFTPTASDPNGDTLAFSRNNATLPPGLSFNTATGALSGTATTAGTYAGIVISVSDGKGGTASLPAFTITVASATGSAVLTWTAPTLNTDGSSLTDLTGYVVYCGTNATSLTSCVSVNSGTTTSATVPNLPTGVTYYFAIASVSASGGEGNKSNVASKTI